MKSQNGIFGWCIGGCWVTQAVNSRVFTHIQNETNKFSTEENHHKVEKLIITKLRNPRVGLTLTTVIKERKKERKEKASFLLWVSQLRDVAITTFHGKKAR
jgi:predicted GIY-YIG superfamily endonuclease